MSDEQFKANALDEFIELLPRIMERLETYGRNSHFGSPSESVWLDVCRWRDKWERAWLAVPQKPKSKEAAK